MGTIQVKRGAKATMPTGAAGEPLWATDTNELYVGTGTANVLVGPGGGGGGGISGVQVREAAGAYTVARPKISFTEGANVTLTVADDPTAGEVDITIAATAGAGTVTSVALALPGIFAVSGSPVTTSGTLTGALATQAANAVWAGPSSGAAAPPTFRALAAADVPSLTAAKVSDFAEAVDDRVAALLVAGANVTLTYDDIANTLTVAATAGGTGTVTSVGLSLPGIFTVTGSPVTGSGTLTGALATQAANTVWSGPSSGAAAAPTFRALAAADIPSLSATYSLVGHTHTASNVTDFGEAVDDRVALLLRAGTNVGLTYDDAAGTLTIDAAGGGGGGGTVTSVGLSLPGIFTVSGSPVTVSGTLTGALATQAANAVWAGPSSGAAAAPAFRALTATDIPSLSGTYSTVGHTHTASQVTDFSEAVDDRVFALLKAGSNVTLTYDDTAGTLAIDAAAGGVQVCTEGVVDDPLLVEDGTALLVEDGTALAVGTAGGADACTPIRSRLRFIPGANVTIAVTDDATAGEIGVAVAAAAGGTGTVTSVGLSLPGIFTVSGSPVTASGTLTGALATQAANTVWAGPSSGAAAAPAFRPLTAGDIPSLSATYSVVGHTHTSTNITDFAEATDDRVFALLKAGANVTLTYDDVANTLTIAATAGGTGTVTSVGLSLPGIFTVSGSPVTTSGTLTGALATQAANTVWAGPSSGVAAAPTFRTLVAADIPSLSATYSLVGHTHTSGNITDFAEAVDDRVAALLVAGTNVGLTYDDVAGTLTIAALDSPTYGTATTTTLNSTNVTSSNLTATGSFILPLSAPGTPAAGNMYVDAGGGLQVYANGAWVKPPVAGIQVRKDTGTYTAARPKLNLIQGSNVTLTVADDATDDEVDVTVAATTSGITGVQVRKNSATYGTAWPKLNFIEGSGVTLIVADDTTSGETDITITAAGGGGGTVTVQAADGTPSYASISTLQVDEAAGLTVSNPSAGAARVGIQYLACSTMGAAPTGATTYVANINGELVFGAGTAQRASIDGGGNFAPSVDNAVTCGKAARRWASVWAVTGTIQTSGVDEKEDVADSRLGLTFVEALRPVDFRFRGGPGPGPGRPKPRHLGLLGHEVKEALDAAGVADAACYVRDEETGAEGLRYTELIAVLVRAVQELAARVRALEGGGPA